MVNGKVGIPMVNRNMMDIMKMEMPLVIGVHGIIPENLSAKRNFNMNCRS